MMSMVTAIIIVDSSPACAMVSGASSSALTAILDARAVRGARVRGSNPYRLAARPRMMAPMPTRIDAQTRLMAHPLSYREAGQPYDLQFSDN